MTIYGQRIEFYTKYERCDVCIRICMMTTAVSKPSRNTKRVSEAKLSINLALSAMKEDFFPLPYFGRLFHHSKVFFFFCQYSRNKFKYS